MNLVRHELYKIFSKKVVIIGIVMLVGFTLLKALQLSDINNVFKTYNNAVKSGQNPIMISKEKYEILYNTISYPNIWWLNHEKQLTELKNEITKLEKVNGTNSYTYREKNLEYTYLKKIASPDTNSYSSIWQCIFNNDDIYCFIAFLIILGISPIFSEEYSTSVDALILSSKKGRNPIVRAKLLAAVAYIFVIAGFACTLQTILDISMLGNGNWSNPIQIYYSTVAFPLSMFGYFVLQFLTNLAADIALGLFILVVSAKAKNLLIPAFTGIVAVVAINVIGSIQSILPQGLKNLTDFYYIRYIYSDYLYKNFKEFNILGHPVLYPYLAFFVMLVASISCILMTKRLFIKHSVSN
ncbi:hypothetical protein G9F72_011315 [Clostridium estertheticum]|uniref:hypothetical protein n=1 Tax=Clostridium estertheticum TaxID=238834 RepID=UPI0013E98FF3|nr:hypothetical protein [Clostridium estertheticum]MBZ9686914.1 hypothetical protein [Clostridium estertheticum]